MAKAVVDTNVLLSGLLRKEGNPRGIYTAFKNGRFKLILSGLIFEEIVLVTARNKFNRLIDSLERKELIYFLETRGEFIIPSKTVSACRDPEDNHILSCALAAKAEYIVTGDKDLLCLNPFRGVSIVSPKEFIDILRSDKP